MSYPLKRNPYVCWTTTNLARIRWETYGPVGGELWIGGQPAAQTYGPYHRATVVGLQAGTTYTYTIKIAGRTAYTSAFKTPPASGLVKFIVIGSSSTSGSAPQQLVAQAILRHDADFVIHVGDIILPNGERNLQDLLYFNQYGPSIERVPWYHMMSAHDYVSERGMPHWDNFDKPGVTEGPGIVPIQKNFKFSIANIDVFMLDTWQSFFTLFGDGSVPQTGYSLTDATWLDAQLAASTAAWKIVAHNSTPYTCETTHGNELGLRTQIETILKNRGVQLSFAGLNRLYHRTDYVYNNAVVAANTAPIYVTCGNGGSGLYPAVGSQAWTLVNDSSHGYVYCEINGTNFTGYAYTKPQYFAVSDVTDTFTAASHGLSNDQRLVFFTTGTLPGGISTSTVYYVIAAAANTFQISLTSGGAAVDISAVAGSGRHMFQRRIETWTQTA